MFQKQIRACLSGQAFYYLVTDTGEKVHVPAIIREEFQEAYEIYDNISHFGLPHGQGWANELESVLYIYKRFKNAFENCKMEIERRALKRGSKS